MKKAIIRFNVLLSPEEMQAIANRIRKEWKESGIVIVSKECDVFIVDEAEIENAAEVKHEHRKQ